MSQKMDLNSPPHGVVVVRTIRLHRTI